MKTEYGKLMEEKEKLNKLHGLERDALNADFTQELRSAYKSKFPKRKFSRELSKKNNTEEHEVIFNKWQEKATAIGKVQAKDLEELMARVKAEGKKADIPKFRGMTLFQSVSSSTYSSQGFGSHKYAKSHAEEYLEKAKSYGLDVYLREVLVCEGRDCCGYPFRVVDYEVWVSTSEEGAEILGYKSYKGTDAEWVKRCQERGVNVRVYLPFIPDEEVRRLEKAV